MINKKISERHFLKHSAVVAAHVILANMAWAFVGTAPCDVIEHLNIPYGADHVRQKLDVFRPADNPGAPLIILIHGGGWFRGERAWTYQNAIMLAQNGYAAATIGYRRVSDYPDWKTKNSSLMWNNMKSDLMHAAQYLADNAAFFGIDASRAIVMGGSAGGHLALAMKARAAVWVQQGIVSRTPEIIGAIAYNPASDLKNIRNPYLRALEKNIPVDDIDPINMDTNQFEGVLLVHGEADTNVPLSQSKRFIDHLADYGVNAQLAIVQDAEHSFNYELGLDASLAPNGRWILPSRKFVVAHGQTGFDATMVYIKRQQGYDLPYTPFFAAPQYYYYGDRPLLSTPKPLSPTASLVFPGKEWTRRNPEDFGIYREALDRIDELMKKAQANGVLIRNGYLIAEWNYAGPPDTRIKVKSITKAITGTLLGLAIHDRLIPGLDAKVKDYWPEFNAGPYTADITFRHLITATSGLKTTAPYWQHFIKQGVGIEYKKPGIEWAYHNDHTMYLAGALTYLFEQDLLEVLRERILKKIGADADWTTLGEGAPEGIGAHGTHRSPNSDDVDVPSGHIALHDGRQVRLVAGFSRSHWTARDLARVGWLHLNLGNWNGEQIIDRDFAEECRRRIPKPPHTEYSPENSLPYGLAWRVISSPENDNDEWWFMSGSGGQFCLLIPEHNIVMVKLNNWRNITTTGDRSRPQVVLEDFAPLISRLVD